MKKLIEAFKKEEYMEYVFALFGIVVFLYALIGETLIDKIISNSSTALAVSITSISLGLGCFFMYRAVKHDQVLGNMKKDERELQHDYEVAHTGYQVLMALVGTYWFLFDMSNLWLLGIIVVTLCTRLIYRVSLED